MAWTSDAYFGGRDSALEFAVSVRDVDLKRLLRNAIPRGDLVQIGRYLLDSQRAPDTYDNDFSDQLLELGAEFEQQDDRDSAILVFKVGLYLYPAHEKLTEALQSLEAG